MDVLIDAADDENFVVVADRLRAEELLWLLEGALHAFDLAHFCVQGEAVGDPTVVAAENQDFGVVQGEAAHGVAR